MAIPGSDKLFSGSIAALYESCLVPLLFEPYAADLAHRLSQRPCERVLEIAAGTGVATRALAAALPARTSIVATDLNQAMLDQAARTTIPRPVSWRQADATALPFDDATFDAVVCQFGAMFFPDKPKAFSEVRRVLKGGGPFIFSVWDRIETNEFADVITSALGTLFPDDPPRFLARTPHGYYDGRRIAEDVGAAGFRSPRIDTVSARSRAESPRVAAVAYCQGTPLRNEIEARDPVALEKATDVATAAMAGRFGHGPVDGKIQAHVVSVDR